MQAKAVAAALLALAARASAQTTVAPEVQASVLLVLASAIPADSAVYALASSSAFAAEMASSLAAGNTPTWYQALPSDVLSLLPQIYPPAAEATPSASPSPTPSPTPTPSASPAASSSAVYASISPAPTGVNSTSVSVQSPTLSASAAPTFTGAAAAFPTAAVGAGLGAALGFLGMLAL